MKYSSINQRLIKSLKFVLLVVFCGTLSSFDLNGNDKEKKKSSKTTVLAGDTDGDGVDDAIDEDDDNDGILDIVENAVLDYNNNITIKQSVSISTTAGFVGNISNLLNLNLNATGQYFTNSGITNKSLVILEFPKPVILTGLEYYIGNSNMTDNGAVTKIQASNDGTTWVDISGASFTKSGPNNTAGVLSSAPYAETFLWTNTTAYKYYRHHGVSGGMNQVPWVYEIFFRLDPVLDIDGDGLINSEDLDSDGDGIPDNVEAQSTSGYIAPNADTPTQYSTNSGKNSAYLTGLTPPDLNNNFCPDYLDTDADGDGVLDKDESGLTFNNAPGSNGLDSGSETVDDYTDVNGVVDNPLAILSNVINVAEADYRVQPAPGGIFPNLSTWLKADNKVFKDLGSSPALNGDFVQQWTTQIGTNNATQTNASRTPIYRGGNTPEGINFNPAVDFDVDKLDFPSTLGLEGLNPFTVIFLTKQTAYGRFLGPVSNSGGRFEIDVVPLSAARAGQTGYGPDPLSSNTGDNLPYISTVRKDPSDIYFQTNGQQSSVDAQSVSFAGGQNISLGTAYNINPYFNGSLSEFIVYDSKLDSVSLNKVYSYLAIKYGAELSPNQVQYSASDGTVIWNDVTYWHNVGVIGRDLASGLIQVQSASQQDSTLAIGLGVVDSLNSSNPNSFAANNTFLAWGSNDQAQNMSIPLTGTDLRHSQRIYKVKEVNTVGNVEVRIHESVFSGGSPTLIRSTDDTFTTADELISLSKSGSYYRFTIDFADGDYFTFAQAPQVLVSTVETTCNGPVANQDGKLVLNSAAPVALKVGYSKGPTYTGAAWSSASSVTILPLTLTDTLHNPVDFEEPFTIRTYFSETFFIDKVVSMKPKVCATAELSVVMTPTSGSANEGEFLTYEVTLTNAGPDPGAEVDVKVEVPGAVELLSTVPDIGAYDGGSQLWSIPSVPIGSHKLIITYKMK